MSKRHNPISSQEWLDHITSVRGTKDIPNLQSAINLYKGKNQELLEKGLGISEILLSLGLDNETLATALVYPGLHAHEFHIDAISETLGEGSVKMLNDLLQMQSLGKLHELQQRGGAQLENLRKMLLAMVTDIRAVLIVLAERLWQLHHAKNSEASEQQKLAEETFVTLCAVSKSSWRMAVEMGNRRYVSALFAAGYV